VKYRKKSIVAEASPFKNVTSLLNVPDGSERLYTEKKMYTTERSFQKDAFVETLRYAGGIMNPVEED